MGLFNLFGGKKKDSPKTSAKASARSTDATASAVAAARTGSAQVKLRLKLVHSLRSGEHAAAYEAAKGLADIQTKAGRRTVARVWRDEAERIKALDPALAA